MPESVSVVVACRNEARHIRQFLDSLLTQDTRDLCVEVLIADGMSEDGTAEILESYQSKHPQIRTMRNRGKIVSTGLNAAVRRARGDIIIRMDAHTEYAPDYIRQCVEVLRETTADNVGGVPRVRPDGFRMRLFGAAYHSPFASGGARSHDASFEGYVDSVFYGCWQKSKLEKLGLFDETLVRNQDDELNLRLVRSGGRIWQSRRIVCWYQPRSTVASLFRQYFEYGFWKVAVIRKHRLPAAWRHLAPGGFVAANLALASAWVVSTVFGWEVVSRLSVVAWLALLILYGLASLAAAIREVPRAGWSTAICLPPLFAVYHVSYGVGFLLGAWRWLTRREVKR